MTSTFLTSSIPSQDILLLGDISLSSLGNIGDCVFSPLEVKCPHVTSSGPLVVYGSDLCHVRPETVIANVKSLILHHAKALNDDDKQTLPDGLGRVYSVSEK